MLVGQVIQSDPAQEPITLAEAKQHLYYDDTDRDNDISGKISQARGIVEAFLKRRLITQTWTIVYDCFDRELIIPLAPVQSVDAIRYLDDAGASQTLAASLWRASERFEPVRIEPAYAQTWPSTRLVREAVEVDVTVGYGEDGTMVDPAIRAAIFRVLGDLWENRENAQMGSVNALPLDISNLLTPHVFHG